tara:strand:+ start:5476 stop:8679 length:3204 start_codon:yes stop_codon:yes gene_type:complete
MSNISFRGSARRKGFNPIQVPNQSQKILAEGERTIRGMRDVAQANRRNREEFLDVTKENQRKVAYQNEKNEDLRKQFAKGYLDAELQHLKTKIKDVSPGGGDYMNFQTREKLKELIPKAIQSVGQIQEMRLQSATEKATALGSANVFRTQEEIQAFRFANQNIGWAQEAMNRVIDRAEAIDPKLAAHIRGLGGMDLLATSNLFLAEQGKNGFSKWINEGGGAELKNEATGYTLNVLRTKGDTEAARDHINFLEGKFKAQFGQYKSDGSMRLEGASMQAIAHHMDPYIQRAKEEVLKYTRSNELTRLEQEKQDKINTTFRAAVIAEGGPKQGFTAENIVNWHQIESAGNPQKKIANLDFAGHKLVSMARTGELDVGDIDRIMQSEVCINGKCDVFMNQPQWKEWLHKASKASADRAALQTKRNDEHEKAFSNFIMEDTINTSKGLGRPLNAEEIKELKETVVGRGYNTDNPNWSWLKDYENAEEADYRADEERLKALEEKGQLDLRTLYMDPTLHPSLIEKYKDKAKDSFKNLPENTRKYYIKGIEQAVAAKEAENGTPRTRDSRGAQTEAMTARAIMDYHTRAQQKVASGSFSSTADAYDVAFTELTKDISDGKGIYELNKNSDGVTIDYDNPGFKHFGQVSIDVKGLEYKQQALEDRNFISLSSDNGGVARADVQEIVKQPLTGQYPSIVHKIKQAYPNKTLNEVANSILEANGLDPIEPRGLSRVERYVHPSVKKLITKHASTARINRATEKTTKMMNPNVDPKEVELEMSKTPNAVAADPEDNGHNAVTTPNTTGTTTGTEMFGKPITEMTTGEVSELQNQGRLGEVGAFGIDGKTLKFYIDSGLVSYDDPFDDVTQRTIALENNADLAGTFFANADSLEPIYGIGQRWYTDESELMTPISGLGPLAVEALRIQADETLDQIGEGFEIAGKAVKEEVLNPVKEGFEIAGETTQAAAKKYVKDPVDATVQQVGEGFQTAAESIQDTSKRLVYDPTMAATKAVKTQFKNLWESQITERVERWEEALTQYISMKQQLAGQGWDVYKFRPEVEGVLMNHTINNYVEAE